MDYCSIAILKTTSSPPTLLLLIILVIFDLRRFQCLLVTDINVPQIVDFRDNVTLSCSYDISGHTLNSVKWYKNDMEFFRYSPLMQPIYLKFPVDGVQMIDGRNECNEFSCRIELNLLGVKSSGTYRCEVSGDAPHFKLTASTANMSVEALPQNNPLISNFHSMYRFDDFVQANCTSDFSSLLTKLSWYINGQKAAFVDLQPNIETTIAAHDYNLRRMVSQLNFYANEPRFHQQHQQLKQHQQVQLQEQQHKRRQPPSLGYGLKLRCVAEIENYPELRRESTLNALLLHDDIDLKNQKLVNSATKAMMALRALLIVASTVTAISMRHIQWLTWQYGGRKSTRFKVSSSSSCNKNILALR